MTAAHPHPLFIVSAPTGNGDHKLFARVLADEIPSLCRFLKMCRAYSLRTLVRLNRRNIKTARIMILCVATATSLPLGAGAILFLFFLLHLDTDMTPRSYVLFLMGS